LLDSYTDIFNDVPGKTTLLEHKIEILPGTKPVKMSPYRANPMKMDLIKKEIEDMKSMGIIKDSCSPWASPILLVPKSDGTVRFVTDFRIVNAVTVRVLIRSRE
jgi:hypothetical protein